MIRWITLTEIGERIKREHGLIEEERKLTYYSCIHDICCGWVDIISVSKTHNIIRCRHCGLRVVIPKEVGTFEKLQAHFRAERNKTRRILQCLRKIQENLKN